jgi:hypothetical protein
VIRGKENADAKSRDTGTPGSTLHEGGFDNMDRLNLFNPFEHKAAEHEDRTTWALMVALRYDIDLQRCFRELVLGQLPAGRIPDSWQWQPAAVFTQTTQIPTAASTIVSVVISDEALDREVPVRWCSRDAVYDGVVHFPDGLVLIIENKPSRTNVRKLQLSPSRKSFSAAEGTVDLYEKAVSISWPQVLEILLQYSEAPSTPYAGRRIAGDLLDFMAKEKPKLTPYRTFRLCGGRAEALKKRVQMLVEELGQMKGLDAFFRLDYAYVSLPGRTAEEAHFCVADTTTGALGIKQALYPADTVGQADAFFPSVDRERFLALEEHGWQVKSHLHFAFMGTQLLWPTTRLKTREYFDCFAARPKRYGRRDIGPDRKLPELRDWVEDGLISADDVEKIGELFLRTKRNHINVIPGFSVVRWWKIEELADLEEKGILLDRLVDTFNVALGAWGEKI